MLLSNKTINEIGRIDGSAMQHKIKRLSALSIVEMGRGWLNELFWQTIAEGLINNNLTSDLDIVDLLQRPTLHNPYLKMAELPAFLHILNNYQNARQTVLGIYLLLMPGVKIGELRQTTFEQFDLVYQIWKIQPQNIKQPQRQTKTANDAIPHYIVPLPTQVVMIIKVRLTVKATTATRHPISVKTP